jgi:hypothetical protein
MAFTNDFIPAGSPEYLKKCFRNIKFYFNFLFRYFVSGDDAKGSANISFGYNYIDSLGSLLVLHDQSGERVTCSYIGSLGNNPSFFN